jgi:hypothetical protein
MEMRKLAAIALFTLSLSLLLLQPQALADKEFTLTSPQIKRY